MHMQQVATSMQKQGLNLPPATSTFPPAPQDAGDDPLPQTLHPTPTSVLSQEHVEPFLSSLKPNIRRKQKAIKTVKNPTSNA